MNYLKNPSQIYQLSEQRVQQVLSEYNSTSTPSAALIRMVHACADPSIVDDFRSSPNAEQYGEKALSNGATILCDCEMVKNGVVTNRLKAKNLLLCFLNHPETSNIAQRNHTTRSAAAVDHWKDKLEGSIVLIGNAPTALFALLELLSTEKSRPSLIIGMPVGFVGAAESKQALVEMAGDIPYLTLLGRRGGSAIAAAAMNSLAGGLGS